jgi:uncharacterized protein (TIGR03000 family)
MKKFLVVAAIAWGLSLSAGAAPALAQRGGVPAAGRFTGGNAGISRYAGQPTTSGVYFWQSYYGHIYPSSAASALSPGGVLEDYYSNNLDNPGAINGPHRSYAVTGEEPSYGAEVYAALRASGRLSGADQGRTAYYRPTPANGAATVHVVVSDPEARVYFDDTKTVQTGENRTFTSPPLDPNKSYTYTVRATWMENGREVTHSEDVKVQAGSDATVDFRGRRKTPDK